MWLIWSLLSALIFAISSITLKGAARRALSERLVFLTLYAVGALFFFIIHHEQIWHLKFFSYSFFLWSTIIGFGSLAGNACMVKALGLGPAGLTSVLLNIGIVFIIGMSVIWYSEKLDLLKLLIILLLLISILLVKFDPKESLSIKSSSWLFLVLAASFFFFIREGGLKITQEIGYSNGLVLCLSYTLCTIVIFFDIIIKKRKYAMRINFIQSARHWRKIRLPLVYGAVAGLCSAAGLEAFIQGLASGPTSLVVLIFASRSLIITFTCYFLFKERLTPLQWSALLVAFVGIFLASFS